MELTPAKWCLFAMLTGLATYGLCRASLDAFELINAKRKQCIPTADSACCRSQDACSDDAESSDGDGEEEDLDSNLDVAEADDMEMLSDEFTLQLKPSVSAQ
mgnify:CR=1 FL=1